MSSPISLTIALVHASRQPPPPEPKRRRRPSLPAPVIAGKRAERDLSALVTREGRVVDVERARSARPRGTLLTGPACARLLAPSRLDCVRPEMARADPRIEERVGTAERPYVVRPDRLYTRDDLMQGWRPGADHSITLDGRIYEYVKAHGGRAPDVEEGLAQRTHDHFIDVALARFLMRTGRPVVGIMGGSSTVAADPNYRRVVQLDGLAHRARVPGRRRRWPRDHGGGESRRVPRRSLGR